MKISDYGIVCDPCRKRYAFLSQKDWFTKIKYTQLSSHIKECDFCNSRVLDMSDLLKIRNGDGEWTDSLGWLITPSDLRSLKLNILAVQLRGIDF